MPNARACIVLLLAMSSPALPGTEVEAGVRPGTLLIYYGYPSGINARWTIEGAAEELGVYDYVVLGDGLCLPDHPDHANTAAILVHPSMAGTRVFGYVDAGVSTQNLPMPELQQRIDLWDAMGVFGIFLDDFGYDFGTSRARQNDAVAYAHAAGLAVVANAFRPEEALGQLADPTHNPAATPPLLGAADFYLYESHGVRLGEYEDEDAWVQKAGLLETYRQQLGVRVLSITTTATDGVAAYDQERFFYAWYAAMLYGHEATGWGEYAFAATGASNGQAPLRNPPVLNPGDTFTGAVARAGPVHARMTDLGQIYVNGSTRQYVFNPRPLAATRASVPARASLGSPYPNPCNPSASIPLLAHSPTQVRVSIHDAAGRLVCVVLDGAIRPGQRAAAWRGVDAAGRSVASGSYRVVLEVDGRTESRPLVLAR